MPDPEAPAEFTSDEHREAHIAALEVELAHLKEHAASQRSAERHAEAEDSERRQGEVQAQLERLGPQATAQKRPRGVGRETREA